MVRLQELKGLTTIMIQHMGGIYDDDEKEAGTPDF